jgi:hypothetical protein
VAPYISASKKRTPDSDEAATDGRKVATFVAVSIFNLETEKLDKS